MKLIIQHNDGGLFEPTTEPIEGRSLRDIWRKLCGKLSVSGPRTMTAAEAWGYGNPVGRQVTASLYDGQDSIIDSKGRKLRI